MANEVEMRIIPNVSGEVSFDIQGRMHDCALALLQRIFILLLTDGDSRYRGNSEGALLQLLDGCNTPDDQTLSYMLSAAISEVLDILDTEDRGNIKSLRGYADNGQLICELTYIDGVSITGVLLNV